MSNEYVYNLDLPNIGIHACKICASFYNGDFGFAGVCNPCLDGGSE